MFYKQVTAGCQLTLCTGDGLGELYLIRGNILTYETLLNHCLQVLLSRCGVISCCLFLHHWCPVNRVVSDGKLILMKALKKYASVFIPCVLV